MNQLLILTSVAFFISANGRALLQYNQDCSSPSDNCPVSDSNTASIATNFRQPTSAGKTCDPMSSSCEPPLKCINNECTTPTTRTEKYSETVSVADCTTEGFECEKYEICVETSTLGKQCITPRSIGNTCSPNTLQMCNTDLTCVDSVCVKVIPEHSPCDSNSRTSVCENADKGVICAGHPDRKICMRPVALGHPCGPSSSKYWVCDRGFRCRRGACVKLLRVGQDCKRDLTECPNGSLCIYGKIGRRCVKLESTTNRNQGSWVIFSARAASILFWNGRRVADNFGGGNYTAVKVNIEIGDVLSFKMFGVKDEDSWNGLIVAVIGKFDHENRKWVARTEDTEDIDVNDNNKKRKSRIWYWGARVEDKNDEVEGNRKWMLPEYDDGYCGNHLSEDERDWNPLEAVMFFGSNSGYSKYFPYWTGAEYVSAEGADPKENVYFRLKFGVPNCS